MNKWSFTGITIGISTSIIAVIFIMFVIQQYGFAYPDTDKLISYSFLGILGSLTGILISCVAFLYHRAIEQGKTIDLMEEHMQDYLYEKSKGGETR